jgi:hypothetical protein
VHASPETASNARQLPLGSTFYDQAMPPQNPVTRLRKVASDLNRFADELDAGTDLEPTVLRYWHAQLLEISAELDRSSSPARDRA